MGTGAAEVKVMKHIENIKAYYYFDEAGDPQIVGRKGVNLVATGKT